MYSNCHLNNRNLYMKKYIFKKPHSKNESSKKAIKEKFNFN